jgi:hypothetical protein
MIEIQDKWNTRIQHILNQPLLQGKKHSSLHSNIQETTKRVRNQIQDMTSTIQELDITKRNITSTMLLLKQIHFMILGVEYMIGLTSRKQYHTLGTLLPCLQNLVQKVPQEYTGKYTSCIVELRKQIFTDFEHTFHDGTFSLQSNLLHDGCLVLQSIPEGKNTLSRWYLEWMLQDYRSIFQKNPELQGLQDISRRYAWFKRTLKQYDEQHQSLFPMDWTMDHVLAFHFCQETKRDLAQVMIESERAGTFDTVVMLQAIHTTFDFESKLQQRFGDAFSHILSSGFDSFLWHYVEEQDRLLQEKCQDYKKSLGEVEEGLYTSSFDLFLFYRQTMANCAELSRGKAFFDLCKMYQKWLVWYVDCVQGHMSQDLSSLCLIINTLDYCVGTIEQLEQKMIQEANPEYKSLIQFSSEMELYVNASVVGVTKMVHIVQQGCEPFLMNMTRKSWNALTLVGDQSEYVTQISHHLKHIIPTLKTTLINPKFFRSFCDKFLESFGLMIGVSSRNGCSV